MENFGIGSWLQRRRPKSGSKIALISGDRQLSYAEFAERSDRLANALKAGGVAKGDRVAYLGDNHPAFLETLFACGQLGAIFVPLNTRLAPPEINFQLADCGAVALIHSAGLNGLAASGAEGTRVSRRIVVGDSLPGESTAASTVPDVRPRRRRKTMRTSSPPERPGIWTRKSGSMTGP